MFSVTESCIFVCVLHGDIVSAQLPSVYRQKGLSHEESAPVKMHNSDLGVVHFVSPAGGLLNAQGAQGRPLHISPATFLCIFPGYRYFETAPPFIHNQASPDISSVLQRRSRTSSAPEFCGIAFCHNRTAAPWVKWAKKNITGGQSVIARMAFP